MWIERLISFVWSMDVIEQTIQPNLSRQREKRILVDQKHSVALHTVVEKRVSSLHVTPEINENSLPPQHPKAKVDEGSIVVLILQYEKSNPLNRFLPFLFQKQRFENKNIH